MIVSKKMTALAAAGALAVPGVALGAGHGNGNGGQGNSNSQGSPGKVCRGIKTELKTELKALKGKQNREARAQLRREAQAGYKACISAAAKARKQHNKK